MSDDGAMGIAQRAINATKSVSIDVSSHATDLTTAESQAGQIVFTGPLPSTLTFTINDARQNRLIANKTTGAFDLFVRLSSGGVALAIPANETMRTS